MKNSLTRKILSIILAVTVIFGALPVFAVPTFAASTSDLTFELNDYGDGYIVSDCNTSASGELVIPSEYNGLPVTSIGWGAFSGCTSLTSVTIPDSVTSIGWSAFFGCTSLNAVYISDLAAWCNIDFGNSYSNPLYYAKKLYINGELATDITIPDSVTSIGSYAFFGCTSLISVTIPSSVTYIGDYALGYGEEYYDSDIGEWVYPKIEGFIINGYTYSEAHDYALENDITFNSIGEVEPIRYELN